MKSFVKLHLCHAQKRLKNAVNIPMKQENFKTLRIIRSSAKFTGIRLRPCLNNLKSFKIIDLVKAMKHTFEIV